MNDMSFFDGYPQAGLDFLAELEANNNRDWFQAHKQTYLDALVAPSKAFVEALGLRLQAISPDIVFDTRTNGAGSLMRIYRDIRFSKDKTPYKTHVDMAFWEGPLKKMQNPAFGVRIVAGGGMLMAGVHGFQKPMLEAYRQAVADERLGRELMLAMGMVLAAGDYEIGGEHYKRVPRGFDAGHPRADLLRYAGLYVYSPPLTPADLLSPDLVDICFEHCRNMAPVQRWLVKIAR